MSFCIFMGVFAQKFSILVASLFLNIVDVYSVVFRGVMNKRNSKGFVSFDGETVQRKNTEQYQFEAISKRNFVRNSPVGFK